MRPGIVETFTPGPNGYSVYELKVDRDELVKEIQDAGLFYCPACYSITKDLGIFARPKSSFPSTGEEVFIRWEIELSELVTSASSSCQFCPLIACRLFGDPGFMFVFSNGSGKTTIGCCGEAKVEDRDESCAEKVENLRKFVEENPDANVTVMVQPVNEEWGVGKVRFTVAFSNRVKELGELIGIRSELLVEFYAAEDSLASKFIKTPPINIDPASEKGIQKAQSWIKECFHNHPECPGPTPSKLPARVLHILDKENLILIETNNELSGSYIALSYAWGGPQSFALRSDTISQLTQGFKVSDLPQTLRDAVTLTTKLGHEYIWIDALCIIQDSAVDRNSEIPKMPDYYQNSYVTISAGMAGKATDGFLQIRDECEKHPGRGLAKDLLSMPYMAPDKSISKIYFREESVYRLSGEPVCRRAWTLQERVLSPRVLIYGSRLVWQCNTCQKSDGGVEDWSYDLRASDHRRLHLQFKQLIRSDSHEIAEDPAVNFTTPSSDISELWYRYVQEYSYLELSNPEDKLPALSGLAIEINKSTGDEYLCGLWRSQLLRELMWSHYPLGRSRPAIWRAPSWSWSSVNNQITFSRMPPEEAHPMAQVIECSVTPVSSVSPFGEVSDATLKIRGPVLEFTKDHPEQIASLVKHLKREHSLPPPRNEDKGLDMRRFMINLKLLSEDEEREEWVGPEEVLLLVLFATPRVGEASSIKVTVGHGGKVLESKDDAEEEPDDSSLSSEEDDLIEGFENDKGLLSCLVLVPKEDGTYERVATLTEMFFIGVSKLKKYSQREIEIR